jgi:isorenieratene synthase
VLSAGELMQFFHFYFFGNPEGLAFNGTCQDMGRSLVDPIARLHSGQRGQVITGATVSQVHWQDGQIANVTYQQGSLSEQSHPLLGGAQPPAQHRCGGIFWGGRSRL